MALFRINLCVPLPPRKMTPSPPLLIESGQNKTQAWNGVNDQADAGTRKSSTDQGGGVNMSLTDQGSGVNMDGAVPFYDENMPGSIPAVTEFSPSDNLVRTCSDDSIVN